MRFHLYKRQNDGILRSHGTMRGFFSAPLGDGLVEHGMAEVG